MKNGEIHALAMVGTVALTGLLVAPIALWADSASANSKPLLGDMEEIEASLAYKKPKAPVQPQKKIEEKQPEVKPEGVSHDEQKKTCAEEDKPKSCPGGGVAKCSGTTWKCTEKEDKPPKKDDTDPFKKFKHPTDDDAQKGDKPTDNLPAFDGSEFGRDSETRGHPYWQKLKADLAWDYPQILTATGTPIGCIHLTADGKIPETNLHQKSGDDSLDDAVERALKKIQQLRNQNPVPVPVELLRSATTKWVCFKFDVKG